MFEPESEAGHPGFFIYLPHTPEGNPADENLILPPLNLENKVLLSVEQPSVETLKKSREFITVKPNRRVTIHVCVHRD